MARSIAAALGRARARAARLLDLPRGGGPTFLSNTVALERALFSGTLSDDELGLLRQLVEESNSLPGPLIEIGTLFGFTTLKLAAWKAPKKHVVSVDNYSWNPLGIKPSAHRAWTGSVLYHLTHTGQLDLVDGDKASFYRAYSGEGPALVFLDADHSYEETAADIAWGIQVGAGIVCGHDYAPEFEGVRRAVDAVGGPRRLVGTLWSLY